jgi:hypothetical protein
MMPEGIFSLSLPRSVRSLATNGDASFFESLGLLFVRGHSDNWAYWLSPVRDSRTPCALAAVLLLRERREVKDSRRMGSARITTSITTLTMLVMLEQLLSWGKRLTQGRCMVSPYQDIFPELPFTETIVERTGRR